MAGIWIAPLVAVACVAAGGAGACAFGSFQAWREQVRRRQRRSVLDGTAFAEGSQVLAAEGVASRVLGYALRLERRLSLGATQAHVPARFAGDPHRLLERLRYAGLASVVGQAGCAEARFRLMAAVALAGALAGSAFSNELALLLGVVGAGCGFSAVPWALRAEGRARAEALERELPEMLEVVSLGLRSGLTFDRSLELYHLHFDTPFSHACASAQRQWGLGLKTREDALRQLAGSYDSTLLARVMETTVRSLRFGSSLAENLEAAAAEARSVYRAHREEQVAKAPVKMMVPTGTLILPAMLVLVLGPILLELMEGF